MLKYGKRYLVIESKKYKKKGGYDIFKLLNISWKKCMKAEEKELLRFLEGTDKNFIIPIYQRNYDWKKENCKQLFDDLENLMSKKLNIHFFGSIVCKPEDMEKIIIIDGQQRITTISLLLLAIYNNIKNRNIEVNASLDEKILNEYLINKYSPKDEKIKLKPIKKDREAFKLLFDNKADDFINESNLTQNYEYLYKRVEESKYSVEDIYESIKKLMIVVIQLHENDNPQLIFESMNSTGLDLTEADKIRNYILMDKEYNEQERLYTKYWNKIENNVGYDTTDFIRDYLTIKLQRVPTYNKIYRIFKEDYIIKNNLQVEKVLDEMLIYSKIYSEIKKADTGNNEINNYIANINYLRYKLLYPYLMQLLKHYEEKRLEEKEVKECLKTIETYILRRIICGKPTNALSKGFCNLDKEIVSIIERRKWDINKYAEVLKYVLINKKGHLVFPIDEEFRKAFKEFNLYKTQMFTKNYVMERLENYCNKEKVVSLNKIESNDFSIEHIMPQTLSPAWKKALGENYNEIYEKYLHTIGNLTITGYNSEYSNKLFIEKRDMEKGFKESRLHLNADLAKLEKWGEEEIKERAERLTEKALEIWKMPETNYTEEDEYISAYDLSDTETSFIGKKIKSFRFDNHVYEVNSWKEFCTNIAKFLYDLDKIPFIELVKETDLNSERNAKRFSSNPKDLRSPAKIDDAIYLETNYNTDAILNSIRCIVDAYSIEESEIEFVIKK